MAFRDLTARSNYYYQVDAEREAGVRNSNPRPQHQRQSEPRRTHQADAEKEAAKWNSTPKPRHHQNQSEHEIYCHQMGFLFPDGFNQPYTVRKKSYFDERRQEYRSHSQQYWLVASITTLFFLLQVVIGAIQTALGALRFSHVLVTIFGVIATVIGGILAYLKSRGQPNRTRQLRNSLRKVVEEIEFQEIQLRNPEIKTTAQEAVDYINQLYENARFQAETNYPDNWSTAGTEATKPGIGATGPSTNVNQTSTSSYPISGPPRSSRGNRPPSYHPPQPATTQNTAATPRYTGPPPPDPAANIPSDGGTFLQSPDPAAHIPSEGGKPLQAPQRAAHVSTRGGRYMNEVI